MSVGTQLSVTVHSTSLVHDDDRPLSAVEGLERAFPGLRMQWKISNEGKPTALTERRDAWLAEGIARGKVLMLCNGDESYPVTIGGYQDLVRLAVDGEPQLKLIAHLPLWGPALHVAVDILEQVATGAQALWGHATPDSTSAELASQFVHPGVTGKQLPHGGLPALQPPDKLPSPETPHYLGWLNYWSAAAARAIGFPNPERDADLLARARQTPAGGWVIRLTDEPLDLDKPAHLDALRRAYDRFLAIGGRSIGCPRV